MKKDLEIWRFAAEKLKLKKPVTILIVTESTGSSPGRPGFKLAVAGEELRGSIGGGVMEVRLVELAKGKNKSQIPNPKSKIVFQVHRKNSPDSSGMICSGKQTVIFFELNGSHLITVGEIIDVLENHQPKKLRITNHELLITESENGPNFYFVQTGDDAFLYEEKLGYKNKLIIIGGGHCALALSELMAKMDFYISLYDDRPDLNTLEKNEFVHEKRVIDSYENIGDHIDSGENTYVVVMTLGYKFDEIVIRRLFDRDFRYFGVLGSRTKMMTLLGTLEKEGFDPNRLKQIHTPVGLKINSRTPEEIAVSIAAEIIAVKNRE